MHDLGIVGVAEAAVRVAPVVDAPGAVAAEPERLVAVRRHLLRRERRVPPVRRHVHPRRRRRVRLAHVVPRVHVHRARVVGSRADEVSRVGVRGVAPEEQFRLHAVGDRPGRRRLARPCSKRHFPVRHADRERIGLVHIPLGNRPRAAARLVEAPLGGNLQTPRLRRRRAVRHAVGDELLRQNGQFRRRGNGNQDDSCTRLKYKPACFGHDPFLFKFLIKSESMIPYPTD